MTPERIDLVPRSFSQVAPIADAAAGLFYGGCSRSRRR